MAPATYQYVLTGKGATVFAVDQRGFVYLNVNNVNARNTPGGIYQLTVSHYSV